MIDGNYISSHSLAKFANMVQDRNVDKHTPPSRGGLTLTQEDSGRIVYDHIYKGYKEYIELSMTKHLEAALYNDQCKRMR